MAPQRLVEVEPGRRLHLFCEGEGSPTVILTAGLGDWATTWRLVQHDIAQMTQVCAWDRAGFGFSDPSPHEQTPPQTASDLERLLAAAGVRGSFVLVGHSAGSYESLLFADRRTGDIAGMVLVDPSVPGQTDLFREAVPALSRFLDQLFESQLAVLRQCAADLRSGVLSAGSADPNHCLGVSPTYPAALRAEMMRRNLDPAGWSTALSLLAQFQGGAADTAVLNAGRNYRAMPLIVLTAGAQQPLPPGAPPEATAELPRLEAIWGRAHDALAALSSAGVNRTVPGATYYIQVEKPEVVIAAIREVVEATRRR